MSALPQHAIARAQANEARAAICAFRAELAGLSRREGLAMVAELLEREDAPPVAGARIDRLLYSVHSFGPMRVDELLAWARVGPVRVRDLPAFRRRRIAAALRELIDPLEP